MAKTKIHPLILAALGISAVGMWWRAYNNFSSGLNGYGMAFTILGIFLGGLVAYGILRNQRIDSFNRRHKKGQKLIR